MYELGTLSLTRPLQRIVRPRLSVKVIELLRSELDWYTAALQGKPVDPEPRGAEPTRDRELNHDFQSSIGEGIAVRR